jgi:hypothetical protein
LRSINTQTDAAQEAARAARENTHVLLNAERAWLTVEVENFAEPKDGFPFIWVNATITNNGKTPARVKRIVMTKKQLPIPEGGFGRPAELPPHPEYDPTPTVTVEGKDLIIAPNSTFKHMHVYIAPEDLEEINERKVSLYVYGFVEYFDTVKGLEHKTCFCSIYWVPSPMANEPTGFTFAAIIPATYFCAT